MRDIPERDWRVLRELMPIALERYCRGVLKEAAALAGGSGDTGGGYHDRYLALFKLLRERDGELGNAFNDLKRSTALFKLTCMRRLGLLTDEEFAGFSQETRELVQGIDKAY